MPPLAHHSGLPHEGFPSEKHGGKGICCCTHAACCTASNSYLDSLGVLRNACCLLHSFGSCGLLHPQIGERKGCMHAWGSTCTAARLDSEFSLFEAVLESR
eukprot:scaffold231782_cov21-Tisochrysis_lutea.AAC.1